VALQKIVIEVSGKAQLKSTIDQLKQLGLIDEKNAKAFQQNNKKTQDSLDTTTNKLNLLSSAATNIGTVLTGLFAVNRLISFGQEVVNVRAEFQKFEAVLTNTLGSKSAAQRALNDIKAFAASTPFSVRELTESFVKLANQGFRPTQVEMRKLGDLAASTGKSFDQLTEAIIDAQTGEFERLKEFGIRASKEGDRVQFTFKGVKQEVDFTNKSIRDYILSLGELEGVSGSMVAISKTLGGQISNLGDAWDNLLNTIGGNTEGIIGKSIGLLTEFTQKLNEVLKSTEQKRRDVVSEVVNDASIQRFQKNIDKMVAIAVKGGEDVKTATERITKEQTDKIAKGIESTQAHIKELTEKNAKILKDFEDKSVLTRGSKKPIDAEIAENERLIEALKTNLAIKEGLLSDFSDKQKEIADAAAKAEEDRLEKERLALEKWLKDNKDYIEAKKRLLEIGKELADVPKLEAKTEFEASKVKRKIREEDIEHFKKLSKQYSEQTRKQTEEEVARILNVKEAKIRAQQEAFNAIMDIGNAIFDSQQIRADNELRREDKKDEEEINRLEKRKERGRLSEEALQSAKEAIQRRAEAREKEARRKAAQAEKNQQLFNIAIQTATNTVRAFGTPPVPNFLLAAIAAGAGAIQAGIVAARPLPEFAKGVVDFDGKGTGTSDSNLVKISKGESVITAKATRKYHDVLEAMNKGYDLPIISKKSLTDARNEGMSESIYKSLMLNGNFNDKNIVRAINDSRRSDKADAKLASMIGNNISDRIDENKLFS
jgi:hypothetical protein